MKLTHQGETLSITALDEISARNSAQVQAQVEMLLQDVKSLEIDLSGATFVDCCGLGALVALRNQAQVNRGIRVKFLNPTGAIQRMFRLTGLDAPLPVETPSQDAPKGVNACTARSGNSNAGQALLPEVNIPLAAPTDPPLESVPAPTSVELSA